MKYQRRVGDPRVTLHPSLLDWVTGVLFTWLIWWFLFFFCLPWGKGIIQLKPQQYCRSLQRRCLPAVILSSSCLSADNGERLIRLMWQAGEDRVHDWSLNFLTELNLCSPKWCPETLHIDDTEAQLSFAGGDYRFSFYDCDGPSGLQVKTLQHQQVGLGWCLAYRCAPRW